VDSLTKFGANWDEVGADGTASEADLLARVMELATGARTAVVAIGGLLCGLHNNVTLGEGHQDRVIQEYLSSIDEATMALASLLPENRPVPGAGDSTSEEG
jgi:hypothetical protein